MNHKVDYANEYRKKPNWIKKILWMIPFSKHHKNRVNFIKEILPECKSVIDIGSSEGKLLYLIKKKGIKNAKGIEPNIYYSNFCENYYKIPVIKKYIEDINTIEADLVTATELIEHLEKPERMLKKIKSKYLFLTLPIYNKLTKDHIQSFTPKTILNLLDNHKWKPIKIKFSKDKQYKNYHMYILLKK